MDECKVVVDPENDSPIVVALAEYRGVARLDVRQHYYTHGGELHPTKKGVSLTVPDGLARQVLAAMQEARPEPVVLDERASYPVVVQVSAFRGRLYLDVRRHYRDGEELRPTKKGVSLSLGTGLHTRVLQAMEKLLAGA